MDLFESKEVKPMLISEEREAFDSSEFIYELKIDGVRCIAYLDKAGVELRNKRNDRVLFHYPEMDDIYKLIKCENVILDGELFVLKENRTDFFEIQRRSLMLDKFKIELAAKSLPVSFVAFDALYKDGNVLTNLPLIERKKILQECISENERMSISRYVENEGVKFFKLTTNQGLEGIVAKRKDSKYYFGKRTKDWIKIKNYEDEEFLICGYIQKAGNINSIVIGQMEEGKLIYKGHVTLGVSSEAMKIIKLQSSLKEGLFETKDEVNWIEPKLICTVKYMEKTESGSLRQPVFKGIRGVGDI